MNSTSNLSPELRADFLRQYHLQDSKPEARFDDIVESVAKACGVSAAMLVFVGDETTVVKSSYGIDIPARALDQSLVVSQIVEPMRTIVFNDASQADPEQLEMLHAAGFSHIQALAGLPVLSPNGLALGAFVLMDFAPHDFTMVQIEALARASRRVVELLESNKMAAELVAAKTTATYSDNSRQIVAELVDEILKSNGWWAARCYWVEEGQLHAEPWRFESVAPQSIRRLSELNTSTVVADDSLQFPKPTVLAVEQMSWLGDLEKFQNAGVRNVVVLDVAGVLSFALRLVFVVPNTQALTPDIVASLSTASLLLPKVIRQERARGELHYRATHDSLTGMLNRRGLEQVVEPIEQTATGAVHAVLYLDLDRFKSVNDTHGHAVGDEVLSHVAADLIRQIRPTDVLARLGGDEFLLLALNVTDFEGAKAAADRILKQVNGAFRTKTGLDIPVSVSLGLSLWRAGESFQNAMKLSDALMYQAKKQGGGLVHDELSPNPDSHVNPNRQGANVLSGSQPFVQIMAVMDIASRHKVASLVEVHCTLRSPDPQQIARLIWQELEKPPIEQTSEINISFPNHFWNHNELIPEIVGELKPNISGRHLTVILDCSLASAAVRQVAAQLKQGAHVELLLDNFGSGPNELVMLEQLEPIGLGLAHEAVASLGTLNPKVNSIKTAVAIASALGKKTIAFGLSSQVQIEHLSELGCSQYVFVKQQTDGIK